MSGLFSIQWTDRGDGIPSSLPETSASAARSSATRLPDSDVGPLVRQRDRTLAHCRREHADGSSRLQTISTGRSAEH